MLVIKTGKNCTARRGTQSDPFGKIVTQQVVRSRKIHCKIRQIYADLRFTNIIMTQLLFNIQSNSKFNIKAQKLEIHGEGGRKSEVTKNKEI